MFRAALTVAFVAAALSLAHAQSASAPLVVTATVVSSCRVDVPRSADASIVATLPVTVTCARGATPPRIQRQVGPQLTAGSRSLVPANGPVRDALLIIDF